MPAQRGRTKLRKEVSPETPGMRLDEDIAKLDERREDQGARPWDRLKGEGSKEFASFDLFRIQPPHLRTVKAVWEAEGHRHKKKLYGWCR